MKRTYYCRDCDWIGSDPIRGASDRAVCPKCGESATPYPVE